MWIIAGVISCEICLAVWYTSSVIQMALACLPHKGSASKGTSPDRQATCVSPRKVLHLAREGKIIFL